MKKITLFLLAAVASVASAQSQNGQLRGTVKDPNGQTIPFANVVVLRANQLVTGAVTDLDGKFSITPLMWGTYDVDVSAIGYSKKRMAAMQIDSNQIRILDIVLDNPSNELDMVTVQGAKYEMRQAEQVSSLEVIRPELTASPNRTGKGKVGSGQGAGASPAGQGSPAPSYGWTTHSGNNGTQTKPAKSGTDEFADFKDNTFQSTRHEPLSTFSVDVDKASYTLVRKTIREGRKPEAGAVRTEELINYFDYHYPDPTDGQPFRIITEVTDCPWNKDSRILKLALQGKRLSEKELPPSSFTFLVDVSGSMSSPNKLPLVQASLLKLLDKMRPQDQVGIVVYAGAAGVVLETKPMGNKAQVVERIMGMQAGGSTAGGQGIQMAYKLAEEHFIKDGNNRIILCTDGDFNVGISSESDLTALIEQERQKGVFLTVLGYGMGNYKDSKLKVLADKGNGNYAYIDDYSEAEKFLGKEFAGSMYAIAKDVKIQIEFNPEHVKSYRLIGYEDRLLEAEDFNNDKKDAGEIGSGHTVTALYEIRADEKLLPNIDSLKYQKSAAAITTHSAELATVKFRYKKPDGDQSLLLQQTIANETHAFKQAEESTRFAVTVAAFGQLLRKSPYIKDFTLAEIMDIATAAAGKDEEGFRKEFIDLLKEYKKI